ncbi:GNAT family N-acetyltransferase [Cohnella sp. WQ 127256]|uniref:GNAT family N-acetyltransferase n=1 Tax=Cohnella sp. WQ 127256 TaxID=2938790 RepID=UPI0027424BED|nr:GNAT family N-acetyltransferase [Cohnella sp. WQ 127256]
MLPVTIRKYDRGDFTDLIALQQLSFPPPYPSELWWNEAQLTEHITRFPEGALCVEINGRIVGSMTALRTTIDDLKPHNWSTATDDGYIRNHESNGDTVYVADLCVAPEYRKLGLGKWLLQSMYETVVHLDCLRLLGVGRMPGYYRYMDTLTPELYVERVTNGMLFDPVITFMLRCGRLPIGIVPHYLEDEDSAHYGVLMEWKNPFKRSEWNGVHSSKIN